MAPRTRSSTLAHARHVDSVPDANDQSDSPSEQSDPRQESSDAESSADSEADDESEAQSIRHSDAESSADAGIHSGAELDARQGAGLRWDDLPGECKNKIYRYLMRAHGPLNLQHLGSLPSSSWGKPFQLSAQLLRCNSQIHAEAEPILLGENAYVLWNNLKEIIGTSKARNRRSGLIRRLVIEASEVTRVVNKVRLKEIAGLKNLQKVEFESRSLGRILKDELKDTWETKARSTFSGLHPLFEELMKARPDVQYYFFEEGTVPAFLGKPGVDYVAFEWEITLSDGDVELEIVKQQEYHRQDEGEPRAIQTL